MDWFASALPREGRETGRPRADDAARRDVPTCGLGERCGAVAAGARAAGWNLCVVLDEGQVILGEVDTAALEGDPARDVLEAMRSAPTTIRPHLPLEDAVESLNGRRTDHVLVTTSDGRLRGLLRRADAERRLAAPTEAARNVPG
jgi:CBS domain-containing protein